MAIRCLKSDVVMAIALVLIPVHKVEPLMRVEIEIIVGRVIVSQVLQGDLVLSCLVLLGWEHLNLHSLLACFGVSDEVFLVGDWVRRWALWHHRRLLGWTFRSLLWRLLFRFFL